MSWLQPLCGGFIIGGAVSIMLLMNGRVAGISGIVGGLFKKITPDFYWRFSFVLGLVLGGCVLNIFYPQSFISTTNTPHLVLVISGLLVGFGTLLGQGCTSGHGVCGVSRFSIRSILATTLFIFLGVITVTVIKKFGVF